MVKRPEHVHKQQEDSCDPVVTTDIRYDDDINGFITFGYWSY